ncbi:hypothetical protein [Flindersiella endophytica]
MVRYTRGTIVAVLLTLALAACTGERVPAPSWTDPGQAQTEGAERLPNVSASPSGPPPSPVVGALYGKVTSTNGRAITDAEVSLFQITRDEEIRTGLAMFSLGFYCLIPGWCASPVEAELSSYGYYSFPARVMKQTPDLALSAKRPSRADELSPASTSLSLPNARDPQQAPDVAIWEPALRMEQRGDRIVVRWPRLSGAVHGPEVTYSVWVRSLQDTGARSEQAAGPTTGTSAALDLRVYEDQPTEVVVMASSKANVRGQEVEFGYRTAGHELPPGDTPPSRGRPCVVDGRSGTLVPAKSPCAMTDGDLDLHQEVLAPGDCSVDTKGCEPTRHERLCVDLGHVRPVRLVVLRTPFGFTDMRLETSADGESFRTIGRSRDADVIDVRPRTVRNARYVCVHGSFTGHHIRELSVW